MIEGFQNPGLAIGAALCVVPLIIHLLNRLRYKTVQWAAMMYLLAATRTSTRRAKLRLGLGKGKKQHDKRADKKARDWDRQKARILKNK